MKRAIFPDEKSLQPIPTTNGVHANISGNTNSTTSSLYSETSIPPNNTSTTNTIENSTPTTQKNYTLTIIGAVIIVVMIFILIYTAKNRVKR